jgi:TPR repeat protein
LPYPKNRFCAENNLLAFFQRAADKGNATVMDKLGVLYGDGKGASLRITLRRVSGSKKAVDAGNTDAMINLGTLYKNGKSVAQDSPWWFPSDHTRFFEAEITWPTVE